MSPSNPSLLSTDNTCFRFNLVVFHWTKVFPLAFVPVYLSISNLLSSVYATLWSRSFIAVEHQPNVNKLKGLNERFEGRSTLEPIFDLTFARNLTMMLMAVNGYYTLLITSSRKHSLKLEGEVSLYGWYLT